MKKHWAASFLAAALLIGIMSPIPSAEAADIAVCEAEDGSFTGNVHTEKGSYVSGFQQASDTCTVTADIPEDGFYDLHFSMTGLGGHKENYVSADGQRIGTVKAEQGEFQEDSLHRVYLTRGEHAITLSTFWGYIQWDKVRITQSEPFDESIYQVSAKLSDPDAFDPAKRLFSYLCDQYGKTILSGQYCDTGMNGWENLQIASNNGYRYPAILGLDMGYYSQTGADHGASVHSTEQAIACWEKGGIVTMCWHWLAPEKYITGTWYSAFRPEHVNINLTAIMNGEDPEGLALLQRDIANIADQLKLLQEAGVPVLWRPLHEASGGWFWWGAEGADTYIKLFKLLYETLTNEYGLHNLIWIWNGQSADWYPGDEYVDIVGTDIYAGERVYTSQADVFLATHASANSNKMVVLSENGTMIDPELSARDRAMWGFFCTWSGEFVMKDGLKKAYSEQYTDIDMLKKVYNSDIIITRDELPDLKTYPIRDDAT